MRRSLLPMPATLSRVLLRFGRCGPAAITLLLGGCALSTPPQHADLVAQALPANTRVPTTWVAGAQHVAVADDWLKALQDPALEVIVAEALAHNPDLRQAAARVEAAREAVKVVGARLQPQVGAQLGATARQDRDNGSFNSSFGALGVAWEVDIWGRVRAQTAGAQASAEAVALDYAYARQSLAATTAKLWYLATESQQLVELAGEAVAIYERLLALVQQRRAAGKDSDMNLVDVRARLQSAQSGLLTAQQAAAEVRRSLETLIGRYPSAEISVANRFAPLPPPVAAGLPATLLERRPDLLAAQSAVLAAFRQQEAAQLALLPDVSLTAQGGRVGSGLLALLGLNPWLAAAQVGLSIPIYEGGALRARIAIATAEQAQAVARFGGQSLTAFREVENALASEQYLLNRIPYDERALADRGEAVRIATIQFKAGQRDILWVSRLQAEQLGNQEVVVRARAAQRINRIQLHLALGGSFDARPAAIAQ